MRPLRVPRKQRRSSGGAPGVHHAADDLVLGSPVVYEAPVQQRALKGAECRRVVTDVRAGLAHYGVTLNPTSDLARICKELEWLARDLDSGTVSDRTTRPSL